MTIPPLFKSSFALPAPVSDPAPQRLCASDRPLVLLPIRLETRFFPLTGVATELRVRVYPDKIHLDSHEKDLRPIEVQAGQQYWQQDWAAGTDLDARATAWRRLADNFGVARAAFVARSLTPTNPQDRTTVPPGVPQFPTVQIATVDNAWRTPACARLLPDRWVAILHSGTLPNVRAVGKDIPKTLNVGPDPRLDDTDIKNNPAVDAGLELVADPGMRWMIDFTEAENVGMALRIPLSQPMLTAGLDTLYVFGVSGSLDAMTGAAQLADLLDAHHYTDGLEFPRLGTPTNNTDDRRVSSSEDDLTHARSFGIEVLSNPASLDSGSNAARIGTALGIASARIAPVLGFVDGAAGRHDFDAQSMNGALWPVGWGYFLSNMFGPETIGLTPQLIDWARGHFVSVVRAPGPFPTFRAGRQPYGLLPVTSLDLWKPRAGDESAMTNDVKLQGLLIKLRDSIWRQALPTVARLGSRGSAEGTTPDADADLADVMRVDAFSSTYRTQSVFGAHYLAHLRAFFKEDLTLRNYFNVLDGITNRALQATGLQQTSFMVAPRLKHFTFSGRTFGVTAPLVQAGEVSPWQELEPDYIGELLSFAKIVDLVNAPKNTTAPWSLLQTLLRHSLLREIADTAKRILAAPAAGAPFATIQRDAELVDLIRDLTDPNGLKVLKTQTWKADIASPPPDPTLGQSIQSYIESQVDYSATNVQSLGDVRTSMKHLQTLDTERLQHLMQGTLDLSAHRLDAWVTSFATKRLAAMTPNAGQGAYIGGYGWVENLMPLPGTAIAAPTGEGGAMFTLPRDTGFIHAPSATHAAAAALLRNAQLGAADVASPTSPFAIDLSSRRAREAARLLDGVREGQPLGALLGYRIERRLHELSLDHFIAPLRGLAPIAPSTLPNDAPSAQAIAANNVVDGQLLFRRWKEERQTVIDTITPAGVTADVEVVKVEIDRLGDAIDSVGDALVAEAAYQMARGNNSRLASTLSALAKGDAPPPELEVTRIPRTGTALTHRVLTMFGGTPRPVAGWPAVSLSYRAQFEQPLNAWVSQLLGNPTKVRCTVDRLDVATGAVIETRAFPLSMVPIAPMDVVYGVEEPTGNTPSTAPCEAEQIVLYYAKHNAGGFDVDATLRLQHARPIDLAPDEMALFDVLEQARAIRRLLNSVRAADPEDVNPPERQSNATIDLVELDSRVTRVEAGLLSANNQLAGAISRTTSTCEDLRIALLRLGLFAIGPFVPIVASGESVEGLAALRRQGKALLTISAARMAKGAELRARPAATDPRARRDQLVERFGAVFGQAAIILPYFLFDATSGAEFGKAMTASTQTMGGDALAANTWFARSARVREPLARLGACLRTAEVLKSGVRLDLKVAQLPLVTGERWVGLPTSQAAAIPHSKLSLVVHATAPIVTTGRVSGLVIDEWSEVVPNQKETTALAFQFNPPDACAPQSVLLAVPPVPENDWTVESLHRVLMETLDLAKIRAVDPDLLGAAAHYLPGLYLAFNAKDDAVSTDFAPLTQFQTA